MKKRLISISIVGLMILALGISASEAETEPGGSFSIKAGQFKPDVHNLNVKYDLGNEGLWVETAGLNWKFHRTLELGVEAGYSQYLIPVDLNLRYRFDYAKDQALVPFVAAGFDAYNVYDKDVFKPKTTDTGTTATETEKLNIDSWQYGYHFTAGVQILLDYLNPKQAFRMSDAWGVKNTYLNLEAKFSFVDDFGKKDLDYGGNIYTFGLVFEY